MYTHYVITDTHTLIFSAHTHTQATRINDGEGCILQYGPYTTTQLSTHSHSYSTHMTTHTDEEY